MKYLLDESIANAILGYLSRRPYIEVANIIQAMNGLPVYDEGKKEEPMPTEEEVPKGMLP